MPKTLKIGKDVTDRKDKVKAKPGFWGFVAEGELRKKLHEDETKKPKDQKEMKATQFLVSYHKSQRKQHWKNCLRKSQERKSEPYTMPDVEKNI